MLENNRIDKRLFCGVLMFIMGVAIAGYTILTSDVSKLDFPRHDQRHIATP